MALLRQHVTITAGCRSPKRAATAFSGRPPPTASGMSRPSGPGPPFGLRKNGPGLKTCSGRLDDAAARYTRASRMSPTRAGTVCRGFRQPGGAARQSCDPWTPATCTSEFRENCRTINVIEPGRFYRTVRRSFPAPSASTASGRVLVGGASCDRRGLAGGKQYLPARAADIMGSQPAACHATRHLATPEHGAGYRQQQKSDDVRQTPARAGEETQGRRQARAARPAKRGRGCLSRRAGDVTDGSDRWARTEALASARALSFPKLIPMAPRR